MKYLALGAAAITLAASGSLYARGESLAGPPKSSVRIAGRVLPDNESHAPNDARDRIPDRPEAGDRLVRDMAAKDNKGRAQSLQSLPQDIRLDSGRTEIVISREVDRRMPRLRQSRPAKGTGNLFQQARFALIGGCPPRLSREDDGCAPAGRDRRSVFGTTYRPQLFGYSGYEEGRYVYDDGYLLRLSDTGSVASHLPLLGGALTGGRPWPEAYRSYPVPDYYVDFYGLGGPDSYRYADDVIYRIDPESATIQSVAALLTGDRFIVGNPGPEGYDIYNVPYPYREQYSDTSRTNYRYSDGHIYGIDPTTGLVSSIVDLI
ncbi:hypothetical protein [Qipengyuania spongiae]|uniref:DUF1236 domain-containing protein n=1 Tax=Qipengyuania spongiae TaxID=2909673 RepID=A0ABY5T0Y3_9SPHN|nr:hypothetical protein [Qipengyuania spongiae]UVI40457.1 hypothetical protein L1F33_05805 [Qipengyuania spongiae]